MRSPILAAAALAVATVLPSIAQAQDAAAGERVFAQCRACHQIGPTARNGVGPILNGIFGRNAGSREGYNYSDAYKADDIKNKVWSPENFAVYIRDPRAVTPGTRMVFAGVKNDTQIADLTAYLASFNPDGSRK
ncbi:MAG: cytochrome c family protein [Alphaproteobacteria bacterium]